MDEVRLYFEPTPRMVIAQSGQRHVGGNIFRRKQACTVVLTIRADGKFLPIQIVFKDDRQQKRGTKPLAALADFEGIEGVVAVAAIGTPYSTPATLKAYLRDILRKDADSHGEQDAPILLTWTLGGPT